MMNEVGMENDFKEWGQILIVKGVPAIADSDMVELYMEAVIEEEDIEVRVIEMNSEIGEAQVQLNKPVSDWERMQRNVSERTLCGGHLSVTLVACNTIEVSEVPSSVSTDSLLLYFESKKRSGGGEVVGVWKTEPGRALVRFKDCKDAQNVPRGLHKIGGHEICVSSLTRFPEKEPEPTNQEPTFDVQSQESIEQSYEIRSQESSEQIDDYYFNEVILPSVDEDEKIAEEDIILIESPLSEEKMQEEAEEFVFEDSPISLTSKSESEPEICELEEDVSEVKLVELNEVPTDLTAKKNLEAIEFEVEDITETRISEPIKEAKTFSESVQIEPTNMKFMGCHLDSLATFDDSVKIIINEENNCINITSENKESIFDAKLKILQLSQTLVQSTLPVSGEVIQLLKRPQGVKAIDQIISGCNEKVTYSFEGERLVITCLNRAQLSSLRDILNQQIKSVELPVSSEQKEFLHSLEWRKICNELESELMVVVNKLVYMNESEEMEELVMVEGWGDDVDKAKKRMTAFLEKNRQVEKIIHVKKGQWKIMKDFMKDEIRMTSQISSDSAVEVSFDCRDSDYLVKVKGYGSSPETVETILQNNVISNFVHMNFTESDKPGLKAFFTKGTGKTLLHNIESSMKCYIDVQFQKSSDLKEHNMKREEFSQVQKTDSPMKKSGETRKEESRGVEFISKQNTPGLGESREVEFYEKTEQMHQKLQRIRAVQKSQNYNLSVPPKRRIVPRSASFSHPNRSLLHEDLGETDRLDWDIPSMPEFETISSVPHAVELIVKQGDLTKINREGVQMIVNPVLGGKPMKDAGQLAKTILKCLPAVHQTRVVPHGQVFATDGGTLGFQRVLHMAYGKWHRTQGEQRLQEMIHECLLLAHKQNMSSIAFPPVGCGNMRYPPEVVASCFSREVKKFSRKYPNTSLQKVYVVCFDEESYFIFKDILSMSPDATLSGIDIPHESDSDETRTSPEDSPPSVRRSESFTTRSLLSAAQRRRNRIESDSDEIGISTEYIPPSVRRSKSFINRSSLTSAPRPRIPFGYERKVQDDETIPIIYAPVSLPSVSPVRRSKSIAQIPSPDVHSTPASKMTLVPAVLRKEGVTATFHVDALNWDVLVTVKSQVLDLIKLNYRDEIVSHPALSRLDDSQMKQLSELVSDELVLSLEPSQSQVMLSGGRTAVLEAFHKLHTDLLPKDELNKKGSMGDEPVSVLSPQSSVHLIDSVFEEEPVLNDIRTPPHWKNLGADKPFKSLSIKLNQPGSLVNVDPRLHQAVSNLVQKTWKANLVGHGRDAVHLQHSQIQITSIQCVENASLFMDYAHNKLKMLAQAGNEPYQDIQNLPGGQAVMTAQLTDNVLSSLVDPKINEYLLFHGTKGDNVMGIVQHGLDARLSNTGGMFGQGIYLCESSTKADQYADPKKQRQQGDMTMLLVRVLLGRPYISPGPHPYKRPPCRHCQQEMCKDHAELHDSIIASKKSQGVSLLFREFVIYDKSRCYPEFVIKYRRK